MENTVLKKQNEGFGDDDGSRKMVVTAAYASLTNQLIDAKAESIELRKQNIAEQESKQEPKELAKDEPEMAL